MPVKLQTNAWVTKPVQLDQFEELVRSINDVWLTRVTLPDRLDG